MVLNFNPLRVAHRMPSPSPVAKTPTGNSAATFQSVMQEQQPQAKPPSPAISTPSLHSVAALPNGGLMVNPTGMNALTGGTIPYNPNYYATAEAANQLAQQLGGTVVDLKNHISNNQSEYFLQLPNGTTLNAGNLLSVLNNSVYQENSKVMDGKIAEVLNNNAVGSPQPGTGMYTVQNGHVTYNPTLST